MLAVQRNKHALQHNHRIGLALPTAQDLMGTIKAGLHAAFPFRQHQQLLIVELFITPGSRLQRITVSILILPDIRVALVIQFFHLVPIGRTLIRLQNLSQCATRLVIEVRISLKASADCQRIVLINHLFIFFLLQGSRQFIQHGTAASIAGRLPLWSCGHPRQRFHLVELRTHVSSPAHHQQAHHNSNYLHISIKHHT